ncbi:MAG: ribosome-associated translation inhibitor RaiA [Gammaproteobacteria bacterium]|nr:ribosome-associated translation inhibitor RaiA [Gammaproteobacteria bacterium]
MQLTVTGRHVDLTDALRNRVNTRIKRINRHFKQVTNAHVTLTVEKQQHKAEVNCHISGKDFFADAKSEDMYSAIDDLMHKLDRQIRRHKERLASHNRSNNKPWLR